MKVMTKTDGSFKMLASLFLTLTYQALEAKVEVEMVEAKVEVEMVEAKVEVKMVEGLVLVVVVMLVNCNIITPVS